MMVSTQYFMTHRMRFTRMFLLALTFFWCAVPVRAQELTEYNVKAAMLVKFIPYIEWSGAKALSSGATATVCMVGGNPFGEAAAVFKKASTEKLRIQVVSRAPGALGDCHIAFLAEGVSTAAGDGVLTVGEDTGFTDRGGMIGFRLVGGKVKFEINRQSASAANLKIDARLLEIAIRVIK